MPAGHDSRHGTGVAGNGPTLLSERYRLDALIGQGGVGVVWRARDLQLDRDVALKQLQPAIASDPVAADRFRREATTAASLSHTSLVTIYDVGEDNGIVYLVMELVDGPSVKDVLEQGGPLAAGETAALGHRVAGALMAVHERGLVHRDVKPGNVLLPVDGPPKMVDFGTVHVLGDRAATLTTPGTMLGTIGYVAPEQFEGHDVDPRADVYAVGLLLHECLTGQPTFGTGSIAEMTRRRLSEDVTPASRLVVDVPDELDEVIVRATRRDPAERFPDAEAMASALAPLVPGDGAGRLQALARQYVTPATSSASDDDGSSPPLDTTTVLPRRPDEEPARHGPPPPATPPPPSTPPSPGPVHESAADKTSVLPATPAAPDDDLGAPPSEGRTDESDSRRVLLPVAALAVLAVIVFAVGLAVRGNGGAGQDGGSGEEGGGGGGGDGAVAVADAADFDPLGGGSEHSEDVPKAHDGDPATAWKTEGYNQPDLAPKAGVGMWARADSQPATVTVDLANGGSTVGLYAFEGEPPPDPADWGDPIGSASGEDSVTAEVPDGSTVVLVWFTELPPDGGRHRDGVAEITFGS